MADETKNGTPGPPSDASGAGTSTPKDPKAKAPDAAKLPGGDDFDVAGASPEDFDKHFEILARRAKLATLTAPAAAAPLTVLSAAPQVAPAAPFQPAPGDIRAVHAQTGETRYFDPETWKILGDTTGGWEIAVDKPSEL